MLNWLSGLEVSTLYQHSQAGNRRKNSNEDRNLSFNS